MKFSLFGTALTQSSLVWVAFTSFAILTLATLALLLDKGARREPPHYLLPCRGTVYFAILILAAVFLVGAVGFKIKYFP